MKNQFHHELLIISITCVLAGCGKAGLNVQTSPNPMPHAMALKAEGGLDGGGGNADVTPVEDVRKLISVFPEIFTRTLYRAEPMLDELKNSKFDPSVSEEQSFLAKTLPDLVAVSHAFITEDNIHHHTLRDLVKSGFWHIDAAGPCYDKEGEAHDGSGATSGKVCLDPSRLARIPGAILPSEIFALLMHESAHVMGFGEREAQRIQWISAFIGQRLLSSDDWISQITEKFYNLEWGLELLANEVDRGQDVGAVCLNLAILTSTARTALFDSGLGGYIPSISEPMLDLEDEINVTVGFCTGGSDISNHFVGLTYKEHPKFVAIGDRKTLEDHLRLAQRDLQKLAPAGISFLKAEPVGPEQNEFRTILSQEFEVGRFLESQHLKLFSFPK